MNAGTLLIKGFNLREIRSRDLWEADISFWVPSGALSVGGIGFLTHGFTFC